MMELMIVIVIIGVLAAIGIPSYTGYVERAKKGACLANKRTIETAAGLHWADKGTALTVDNTTGTNDLSEYLTNIGSIKCPKDTGGTAAGYKVEITAAGAITVTCNADTKHN